MGMYSIARMASRFSVIDTGSPAVRSSWTNPWRTSSSDSEAAAAGEAPETVRGLTQTEPAVSGTCSSLRALVMSDWYLSSTCSVSPMTAGSISDLPR